MGKKTLISKVRFTGLMAIAFCFLNGCAVVGPLISIGGLMTTGPLQYAGTVYSIGEYGYHLAVNDKTPDVVIKDKLAAFASGDFLQISPNSSEPAKAPVAVAESSPAKRRIVQRNAQLAALEVRRMAFLKSLSERSMYLGGESTPVNLAYGTTGHVSLD